MYINKKVNIDKKENINKKIEKNNLDKITNNKIYIFLFFLY